MGAPAKSGQEASQASRRSSQGRPGHGPLARFVFCAPVSPGCTLHSARPRRGPEPLTAPALASHCPSGPSRTPTPRLLAARAVVVTPAAVPRAQARCSRGRVAEWRLCPPIGGAPGPATLATSMAPGFHVRRRPGGGFIQRTDTSHLRAPTHLGPCSEQGAEVEECPGRAGGCREEGPPPELDRTAARGGGKPRARTASGSIS